MDNYSEGYQQDEVRYLLWDYWRIIRKRLWLIMAVLVIVVVTTFVTSKRMKPVYQATAQVLIEREKPQVINVEEVLAQYSYFYDYYPTQYKILESRSLARDVIQTLELHRHREFNPEPEERLFNFSVREAVASVLRAVIPKNRSESTSPDNDPDPKEAKDPLAGYINDYLGRLSIEPVLKSRLVNIGFEGHDPVLVARVANAHARAYINRDLERKFTASQEAVGWLSGRLGQLEKKLRESEEALQRFQEKEDIVTLESILSASGGGGENIVAQKLAKLNATLTGARTERIGLETLYRQLRELSRKPGMVESVPQVIQNSLIQKLKENLVDLNRQYSEYREKYGEKHPRMVALRQEIRSLKKRLSIEVNKIAKSVEIEYKAAQAKEQSLQAALDHTKGEVMALNKKAIQYGVLKREVDSNRQMYDMILKRAKETSLTSGLETTNIFIVDRAEIPRRPVRPRVNRNVMLAAVIGLLLGGGLAFFFEYLDNTMHGPDEVKRYLGVPFLGPVGLVTLDKKSPLSELVTLGQPRSEFTESLRNIRTNVVFSYTEPDQNTLAITSPGPLEGKTIISCNLAAIMAQLGRRVLLVDGDMRKPKVHRVFNMEIKPGLSNLILGKCALNEAVRGTHVKLLDVLPAGTIPPNPSEILGSRRMEELLPQLKGQYTFIIFDTPPVLSVTDAAALAGMLHGTILVVKASETTRDHAQRALEHLRDVRARVLGTVINQVDFKKERYYYTYYKYQYYYSDEGEKIERRTRRKGRTSSRPHGGEPRSPSASDV